MTSTVINIIKSFTHSKQKKVLVANCLSALFSGGIPGVKNYLSSRYLKKQAIGGFGIDYGLRDLLVRTKKIQILSQDDKLVERLQKLFANLSLTTILIRNVREINANVPLLAINPGLELKHQDSIVYFTVDLPAFNLTNYRYFWIENPADVSVLQDKFAIKFQQIYVFKFNQPYLSDSMINDPNYYFYRFALACGVISYSQFWNFTHEMITLISSQICLSLPEQQLRRNDFISDARNYNFALFDGLRHELGWIGCGLSYKYLFCLAKKYNLDYLTICEDDVEFYSGFVSRLQLILEYLTQNSSRWDIFSGLIANLDHSANILSIENYQSEEFVYIDKMTSTVFNVYNTSCFNSIIEWNEQNRNMETNTIDRYLESHEDVRVVTLLPFLVGHKEEQYSTLWGFHNSQYNDWIANSTKLLHSKINEFKANSAVSAIR